MNTVEKFKAISVAAKVDNLDDGNIMLLLNAMETLNNPDAKIMWWCHIEQFVSSF